MATDQSPPRLQLIISIAVGTVVVLVGLKFVFDSYFTNVWEGEEQSKLVTPDEVNAMRADQIAKLTNGPAVPIDQAMSMIATKGRLSSTLITPQPSDDLGAVTGWSHLHDGEPAVPTAATSGDGGASAAGTSTQTAPPAPPPGFDGGAGSMNGSMNGGTGPITNGVSTGPTTASDAGAPKPHAPTAGSDAGAPH